MREQDSAPRSLFFSPDGTRMFIVGVSTGSIHSYTLNKPWNVTTAIYDNKHFYVKAQSGTPTGLFFSPDGTRMFVTGISIDSAYSYTLSTAWDISTASYENKSFRMEAQESTPVGLFFSPDGTRMFIAGFNDNNVYSYTLRTPWDISTATYNNSFYVGEQDSVPLALFFSSDGTKMFIIGNSSDSVYSYTLSTPWDVSTAIYDNRSFHVESQERNPLGLFFSPDGTRMFIVGNINDRVHSYTLSEPWVVG